MNALLVSTGPPERKIALENLPVMIGRDPAADLRLNDSWVGHYQCLLDEDDGTLRVLDLGSRLGTFVNGRRIKRAMLMPGDTLTVGRTAFVVHYDRPRRGRPIADRGVLAER